MCFVSLSRKTPSLPPFEQVWQNILNHQGETFYTKTGLELIYNVRNDVLTHNRTSQPLFKNWFQTTYEKWPLKGPGQIPKEFRGPSYLYAILSDPRIIP